jgi:CysZ protein
MRFFKDLFLGLKAYVKAIRFIRKHKLYWFFIPPAILMLVLYKLGELLQHRHVEIKADTMNGIVWTLIQLLMEIAIGLTLMKFAKYLVVIILSPLLSFLSMKCEKILTGKTYPFDGKQLLKDIIRGMKIAFRNILWHYFFFTIIFLISFFGWEDPMHSPVFYLTFVIGFFYYGFSFLDYVNERMDLNVEESILFMRKHRGLAVAIGMIYSLMILVPVNISLLFTGEHFSEGFLTGLSSYIVQLVLWISASCAPILAIVAATLSMHELVDLKKSTRKY